MSDTADGTAAVQAGHRPAIKLDSVLTGSCSISQTGETTLTSAGELDAASADQAYRYVRDAIDTHGGPVTLDVAGLSFCDARGLDALVRMSRYAEQAGSSLQLVAPSPRLVKLTHHRHGPGAAGASGEADRGSNMSTPGPPSGPPGQFPWLVGAKCFPPRYLAQAADRPATFLQFEAFTRLLGSPAAGLL